ncbi:MAG: hypothetical protein BGO70_00350 [Bacteroidetes bacterium 43-93]|nr:hypothetical protein [Bacteroidota bacterium]OJW96171.1 MAG: hypothetical protein BGO70_00350 [Bacteroidetes bacterium 43-93]
MSLQNEASENIYYKFIRFLHNILLNIRQHIGLFLICMIIGITPLLLKNYSDSDLYRANFTVAYDELFRKIYGDRLAKLNTLVQHQQTQTLKNILATDEKTAQALKSVTGKNILGDDLSKDLNTDHIPFVVEIVTDDSSKIIPLQNAIVHFLETGDDFMTKRMEVKMLENKEELDYINKQLNTIDTVYRKSGSAEPLPVPQSKPSDNSTASEQADNSLIEFSYTLYKRKQELMRKQRMPQNLLIIDDAIVSVQKKRSTLLMIVAGSVIGFIFYALIAGIILPAIRFKER